MRRTRAIPGALLGIAALVTMAAMSLAEMQNLNTAHALTNCSTDTASLNAAEQRMLELHNDYRADAGLQPLSASPSLNRAAAWKSQDPSGSVANLSHTDSLGRNPSERAQDCGYPGRAAENIAAGFGSADAAFQAWLGSTGHRQNILTPHYRAIGIGVSGGSWTVKFGLEVEDGSQPLPTATATAAQPSTATTAATQPAPTRTPTTRPTSVPATKTPEPTATVAAPSPTPTTPSSQRQLPLSARMTMPGLARMLEHDS